MSLPADTKTMKSTCQNHEECMKMVQMILDGEASTEQVEHFKSHNLKECMPCIDSYKLSQEIKNALQVKVEKKCCPEQIVNSIANNVKLKLGIVGGLIIAGQATLTIVYCSEIRMLFCA